MKTKAFLASLLLITSYTSFAQEIISDPGYSIHNYKHPNKAAAAKKNTKSISITEDIVVVNKNYKQPATVKIGKGLGIVRNLPIEEYLTWQNPKMPFTKKIARKQEIAIDSLKKKETIID
jgi:hypothetical protein